MELKEHVVDIKRTTELCNTSISEIEMLEKIKIQQENIFNQFSKDTINNIEKTKFKMSEIKDTITTENLFSSNTKLDKKIRKLISNFEKDGSTSSNLKKINLLILAKKYEKNYLIASLSKKFRNFKDIYGETAVNENFNKSIIDTITKLEKNLNRVAELYTVDELSEAIKSAEKSFDNLEAQRLKNNVTPVYSLTHQILNTPKSFFSSVNKVHKGNSLVKSLKLSAKAIPDAYAINNSRKEIKSLYSPGSIDTINNQVKFLENEEKGIIKSNYVLDDDNLNVSDNFVDELLNDLDEKLAYLNQDDPSKNIKAYTNTEKKENNTLEKKEKIKGPDISL